MSENTLCLKIRHIPMRLLYTMSENTLFFKTVWMKRKPVASWTCTKTIAIYHTAMHLFITFSIHNILYNILYPHHSVFILHLSCTHPFYKPLTMNFDIVSANFDSTWCNIMNCDSTFSTWTSRFRLFFPTTHYLSNVLPLQHTPSPTIILYNDLQRQDQQHLLLE